MRRIATLLAAMSMIVTIGVAPASAEKPEPGVVEQVFLINFPSASDVFLFEVDAAQHIGDLTVDTMDCCQPGDLWSVTLTPSLPANPNLEVTGIGDGNIFTYSGAATAHPWISGTVTVAYEDGNDNFGASAFVRFRYDDKKGTGMHVTCTSPDVIGAFCIPWG